MPRSRSPLFVLVAFGLLAITTSDAFGQKKAPKGVKILLLTGGQREHHGYREQALYLSQALENTGRYEVTLAEDASILESPAMAKYDLIIVNADRRDPEFKFTKSQQDALVAWVKAGHGYLSIHGADNAAPDWSREFREMLGGVFTHVGLPDGKVRKGRYAIKVVDTKHPITNGLSDFSLDDELYYQMQIEPGVEPLATTAHDGQDWPVAWTRTHGKGRVFHTTLGHRDFGPGKVDPIQDPNLLKLVIQGVDWVAEGKRS